MALFGKAEHKEIYAAAFCLFQRALYLPAGNAALLLIGKRRYARVQQDFARFGIASIDDLIFPDEAFHFLCENIRVLAAFGKAFGDDKAAVELIFTGWLIKQVTLIVNHLKKFKHAFCKESLVAAGSAEKIDLMDRARGVGFHAVFFHFQLAGFQKGAANALAKLFQPSQRCSEGEHFFEERALNEKEQDRKKPERKPDNRSVSGADTEVTGKECRDEHDDG